MNLSRRRMRRTFLLPTVAIAALLAGVVPFAPSAHGGGVTRVWDPGTLLDDTPANVGITPVMAQHGNAAAAVWSIGGDIWLSERDPATGVWSPRVNLNSAGGTATGAPAVAYGGNGALAIAFASTTTGGTNVRLRWRAAGAAVFATGLGAADALGVAGVQVAVSDTGLPTVAWLRGGPTGGLTVATPTGRGNSLEPVVLVAAGPIADFQIVQPAGRAPTVLWADGGAKPLRKVKARARTATVATWGSTVTVSNLTQTVTTLSAATSPDGSIVLTYGTDPNDTVPGSWTATRTGATWSSPVHIDTTFGLSSAGEVAAGPAGAAAFVWTQEITPGVVQVFVTDRASTTGAWTNRVELTYLNDLSPVTAPLIAMGSGRTWLVSWSGYGATHGGIPAYTGMAGTWTTHPGIFSDDISRAVNPVLLADGTAVIGGAVVDSLFAFTHAMRVMEGRLQNTGPAPLGPATMNGTARVGGLVTCAAPTFVPIPVSRTYAWLRDGTTIARANGRTRIPTLADLGHSLQCRVAATTTGALGGSTTVLSNARVVTKGAAPSATVGSVRVVGTARVGNTVTCHAGTWSPTATYTHTFSWLKDGVRIAGATTAAYALPAGMHGHRIACRQTAARPGYLIGSATSASVLVP